MQIADLKRQLNDKNAPFGVDLAIPKIGGGARKTNHDYTHGHLDELIDIIIEEKAKIFVCAIGVCPKYIVDKLHKNGVYVANVSRDMGGELGEMTWTKGEATALASSPFLDSALDSSRRES